MAYSGVVTPGARPGRCTLGLLVLGWWLITPPYGGPPISRTMGVGCGDPGHANPCAPLSTWTRLGRFKTEEECKKARSDNAAAAYGRDDQEWAALELARCFTEERVRDGPGLRAGE
jgi:hypothetical protein